MLENNQSVRNKKPRSEGSAHLQGHINHHETTGNYTAKGDLDASRCTGSGHMRQI